MIARAWDNMRQHNMLPLGVKVDERDREMAEVLSWVIDFHGHVVNKRWLTLREMQRAGRYRSWRNGDNDANHVVYLANMILMVPSWMEIEFLNGDRLDCQRENIRATGRPR